MRICAFALCLLVALIPHTAAKSTVQLPPGPLPLSYNASGAAAVTTTGFTRIFYSGADNSIHELRGSGVPRPGVNYLDSVRIAASKVRPDSPIAAVQLSREVEDVRIQLEVSSNCSANLSSADQAILHRSGQLSQGIYHTQFDRWRPQRRKTRS